MICLLSGDCRGVLPTLAAESVQCVVDNVTTFRYNPVMNDGRIKKGQRLSPATEFKPGQHWRPHGTGSNNWDGGGYPRMDKHITTTGWQPSCTCGTPETRPCVVLDPFAGAGTTLLCSDRLQRDAIGIELNVAYTEMAMERCRADAPLFTAFPPAEDPEESRMADLFTDMAAD